MEEGHAVLGQHAFRSDALGVVAHEHVGKVGAVVDALCGRLCARGVFREGFDDGGKVGLVEVGKGEPLAGVEADLVRGGGEVVVGHVLHHVSGEDGQHVVLWGHVRPL